MQIEFTKKQFEVLLKAVYLGNWMANSIHVGNREDPRDERLAEIESYILSFTKEFGCDSFAEYDEKEGRHFPTAKLDDATQRYIDEYDEDCFWEELFYRMYERDFARAYPGKQIPRMGLDERFDLEEPFRERWGAELDRHGIDRLEVRERDLSA